MRTMCFENAWDFFFFFTVELRLTSSFGVSVLNHPNPRCSRVLPSVPSFSRRWRRGLASGASFTFTHRSLGGASNRSADRSVVAERRKVPGKPMGGGGTVVYGECTAIDGSQNGGGDGVRSVFLCSASFSSGGAYLDHCVVYLCRLGWLVSKLSKYEYDCIIHAQTLHNVWTYIPTLTAGQPAHGPALSRQSYGSAPPSRVV